MSDVDSSNALEAEQQKALEKKQKKEAKKAKRSQVWQDFKNFIAKGNVMDMAIGVIVGNAFSAIVTAFTNILLSLCTWAVPGGLDGLVTVLPALNASQSASSIAEGLADSYTITQWVSQSITVDGTVIAVSEYADYYTQYGTTMYYSGMAIIDWGTLINTIVSFLIIALTLFVILRVYSSLKNMNAAWKKEIQDYQAKKEAEEAAENGEAPVEEIAPVEEAPAPEPEPVAAPAAVAAEPGDNTRLLEEIRDEIKKLNASVSKE